MAIVNVLTSPAGLSIAVVDNDEMKMVGGAAVMAERHLDTYVPGVPAWQKKFLVRNFNGIIVIHNDLYNTLPEEERNAVILHEEGHFMLGHLDIYARAEESGVMDYDAQELEYEADAWAADRLGAKPMAIGLRKTLDHFFMVLEEAGADPEKLAEGWVAAKAVTNQRIARLVGDLAI